MKVSKRTICKVKKRCVICNKVFYAYGKTTKGRVPIGLRKRREVTCGRRICRLLYRDTRALKRKVKERPGMFKRYFCPHCKKGFYYKYN